MPLNKVSIFISFLFIFTISTSIVFAQNEPQTTTLAELKNAEPPKTPTSAEIMRSRISKAKAYLVVKNYSAAIYELENIRRETNDKTVHRVLNVLLMHSYLEQGDYVKAQGFLKELNKPKNTEAALDYLAVAGQVVSGAKTQHERYKSLGLSVSDRNLPKEASADVENMRTTLELVVEQSKELSSNKAISANAFALLEETSSARSELAKDAYDASRWKDQVSDAREQLVNPNTKIINASGQKPIKSPDLEIVAANEIKAKPITPNTQPEDKIELKSVPENTNAAKIETTEETAKEGETENKPILPTDRKVKIIPSAKRDETTSNGNKKPLNVKSTIEEKPVAEDKSSVKTNDANNDGTVDDGSPLTVGSLIGYATKRVNPVYPSQARSMRMTGTVKVEVVIDKDGNVTKIENTDGPSLLRRAATDAILKWQFRPFERNGQSVEATGFVSFNFDL